MKTELLKITQDLEKGTITDNEARTLLLGLLGVSDSVDTGIYFSYRDENGEIQHNYVSAETAQALLSRWQEQEIKVNEFIANFHKTTDR